MNAAIIIANGLVFLTFIIHTFIGDKEYKILEPEETNISRLEKWIMGRGAFHIVSADFLLASIGLTLINFTNCINNEKQILNFLSIYFFAYGLAFLVTLIISRKFTNSFIRLGQWALMFLISGLIYYGTD